ncbi:MAG TPA: RidA family protein, partial [Thermoanaerobaculia bacterium]|nr:RidA family protein [Thermoanaerobaculia bacterium]
CPFASLLFGQRDPLGGAHMPISIRHDPFPVGTPYHGIYAHGVETRAGARMLYVSGQVGQSPEGDLPPDFHGQCKQALLNVFSILKAANMTPEDIVKMSFYLVRREDMGTLVEVRKELLDGVRPAITTLFVAGLVSPDWLVEVDVVACAE